MAEETQKPAASEEVVAVVEEPQPVAETTDPAAPEPETAAKEEETEAVVAVAEAAVEAETKEEEVKIAQSASFKEETNLVGELPDPQKKALDELKALIQEALNKHEFTAPPPPPPAPAKEEEKPAEEAAPCEEPKTEEKVAEAEAEAETSAPAETVEAKEEEVPPPPPAEETVVVVEEVVAVVDEDGAKTVEAIEETIVAVSAPAEEVATAVEAVEEAEKPKEEGEPAEAVAEAEAPPPAAEPVAPEEVFIFGIPLLGDERSDTILLKFLRARDFKVKDAFTMIKNTVKWRKEFGIEALLEEDLGTDLEKAVFMHGSDKEGHPVCYNVYGAFQDKELYQNCFADEEKRVKFLRWRIQFLEKSIRKLDFSPTGTCTIVQVNDFKNSPGPAKRELRQATNQALSLLQDNYPEFVAKQIFINVPWWYLAFNKMISPFLTQRTKSKFVFAGPSKSAETLFKYISPEQVPVQYGGHSRDGEQEFTVSDSVTEITIKPSSKHTVEFPISETSAFVWELRVVGWEVSYGAEFVPSHEEGYTVIVSKTRKVSPTDEPIIVDSYKIGEPGKIVLTLDNQTSKKKKLLYRTKAKPLVE